MKLNWFSPLPPARSDIAHYTARILPALRNQAEIILWTDQTKWDKALEKYATIRHYELPQVPWQELNRADMNFYNIGNNDLFHASIWQVSRRQPGIVILHDFRLHHFFHSLYRRQGRGDDEYLTQMELHYGPEARQAAAESINYQDSNIDFLAEPYPLTSLALENCLGVVVHTKEAFEELRRANRWLVAYADLPFRAQPFARRSKNIGIKADRSDSQPYRLIIFGYLGRNRRLDSLLTAIASLIERDLFHLDIYGEVRDESQLRALIRTLDLKKLITLHGFVPEAELDSALAEADLAINLRYPTMGEASGSQLRIWAHALPSLVTQTGWYAKVPEGAVVYVRPDQEVADIQHNLRAFLKDPARFITMGERGRRILEEHHDPESYVRIILDLAWKSKAFRPRAVAHNLAERAGMLMSPWAEALSSDEALGRVAEEIYLLTKSSRH
jgi:glycosyltransferase involved in cell wall biosynthesis